MPPPTEDDLRHTSEDSDGGISKVFRPTQQHKGIGAFERWRALSESRARTKGPEAVE
jgi:hypothetical protein